MTYYYILDQNNWNFNMKLWSTKRYYWNSYLWYRLWTIDINCIVDGTIRASPKSWNFEKFNLPKFCKAKFKVHVKPCIFKQFKLIFFFLFTILMKVLILWMENPNFFIEVLDELDLFIDHLHLHSRVHQKFPKITPA
jgi:hypothetical protein